MNKKLCLLAICSAMTSMAHAQSSVMLYGTLDNALADFSNVQGAKGSGNQMRMSSGNLSPNLWGLKGREDLGNGLSAVFKLESGFNIDNGNMGQNGRIFGRTAMVGLSDATAGTITLGRQYDPLIDLIQPLTDDDNFGSAFATPGDIDNYDNSYRTNSSIKYASPTYAGFQWSALYATGGQAGNLSEGQTIAVAAAYNNGPFGVATGYFRATNNGNTTNTGSVGTFDQFNANSVDSPAINGALASARSLQIIRAAGDYTFGPLTVGLSYSNVDYSNYLTTAGGGNDTKYNTGQLMLNYQATQATLLGFGYNYTKGSGSAVNAAYNQFSLGGVYNLSKRTSLYAMAGYQKASGNTTASGTLAPATASFADFGYDASSDAQSMVMVGLRHKF